MHRSELIGILDDALEPHRYKDYAPNGLQVEGKAEITKVLFGVTASEALIDVAIAKQADAIIVHHGYFWKNEDSRILGIKRRRLAKLLAHDINLIAYHLPLDAHPQLGNNVQLAEECGWIVDGCTGKTTCCGMDILQPQYRWQTLPTQLNSVYNVRPLFSVKPTEPSTVLRGVQAAQTAFFLKPSNLGWICLSRERHPNLARISRQKVMSHLLPPDTTQQNAVACGQWQLG